MAQFSDFSDRELMERIYASQLRIMMDVENIRERILTLLEKADPDVVDPIKNENFSKENPYGWRHYYEIHKSFDGAYDEFKDQLGEGL